MNLRPLLISGALLSLTGCAALTQATLGATGAQPLVNQVHIGAGKALTVAYDFLDAAAQIADAAVKSGLLHGAPAGRVHDDIFAAGNLLEAADSAYKSGEAYDFSGAISKAEALIMDAKALAGGKPISGSPPPAL